MFRIGYFLFALILYNGVAGREGRLKIVKRTLPAAADDSLGVVNSTRPVVVKDSLGVVNHTKPVVDTGLASGPGVGVAESKSRRSAARQARGTSAAQRLLLYLSGYEDEDDWPLQSFSPVRRERRRETSVPILVVPVEDLYLPRSGSRNYNRRKFDNDYEQDDDDDDFSEEEVYGSYDRIRRPTYEYEHPKHRFWQDLEDVPRKPKYGKRPSHEITNYDLGYPIDKSKTRYHTENSKPQYPIDNFESRYPTDNPKTRYPADNPKIRYPSDNPKLRYPADNPEQLYPTESLKTQYPIEHSDPRYPIENHKPHYPTDNSEQRYPVESPIPQYPTDDGPLPWTESSSPTRKPVPKPSEPVDPNFTLSGSPLGLLKEFRNYVPKRSGLPPMVQSQFDISERIILPDDEDDGELNEAITVTDGNTNNSFVYDKEIPRPIFSDRLKLSAVLTVPRADYSEYYTAWYDPASGDSRIHFHEGSTVTFRKRLADGLIQKTEMHVDRSGGNVVHDCAYTTNVATSSDLRNPALPDIQLFTFSGFEESVGGLIERWEYNVSGRAGEDGGVSGEALTVHHVFLLKREANEFVRPIRYTVSVDSSILGPDCDGYVHEYLDARTHSRSPTFFEANLDEYCTTVQQLSAASAQEGEKGEEAARLEPLLEFTLPQRDPRYDTIFEEFKATYKRQYINNVEEAVRKNLLMQTSRFVSSGNRAGATFKIAINFLADRSDGEMSKLTGDASVESGNTYSSNIEPFPHPQQSLESLEGLLPAEFSWKDEGLATEVRHQKKCESCSSIAVAGAVEGALFKRTGQLVQLSEQTILNCGKKYGVDGCKPAWPNSAYEYVLHEGLPAYKDAPYKDQKEDCSADKFHIISRISGYVNVTRRSVPALKLAIYHVGPVVVIIRSNTKVLQEYKGGVLYDESCSRSFRQHSMLAVGWGVQNGDEYILIKNSYSTMWGEDGYGKFHARSNTCSILNYPTYPRLEERDVVDKIVY